MEKLITGTLKGDTTAQDAAVLRSLARAYAEGIHARFWSIRPINGETVGWFESAHRIVYLVRLNECQCKAGQVGQFCKHRASLADLTGSLDQLVPGFYERFTPPAGFESLPSLTRDVPPGFAA